MSCVTCDSTPIPPCDCDSSEQCIRINQSCEECAHNICQALDGSQGGGSNAGATAGGAIGGAAAGIVLVTLIWLWYRRKGGRSIPLLGQHFKLKHSRSPSRNLGAHEKGEEVEMPSRPVSRALENRASRLSKRVSIHADDDDDEILEDPFANENDARASIARNSQITSIASVAYQPPDANSMSLEDGHQRTALGEKRRTSQLSTIVEAVSTAAAKPAKKASMKPKSKPIPLRPGRDPALDLVLPNAAPRTPTTPTSAPPVIKLDDPASRFSSSTWATGYTGVRDSSALDSERPYSAVSAQSAASSHPSVMIDPPQLVTSERVEIARATPVVLQASPKQAGKKKQQSSKADENPFTDAASDMLDEALGGAGLAVSPMMRPSSAMSSMTRASGVSVPESSRASLFPAETSSVRAPSTASFSALDGIPFLSSAPEAGRSSGLLPGSPFPRAPARTSTADQSRPTSAASYTGSAAAWSSRGPQSVALPSGSAATASRGLSIADWGDPMRPESSMTAPEDVTRRSGFSSGGALEGVPFQLAFPGERASVAASDRNSTFSEMPEMATARSSMAGEPETLADDPFADPTAEQAARQSTRDDRVSLASLADLVAQIDELPE